MAQVTQILLTIKEQVFTLLATSNTHVDVTVQIVTDAYGSETTWAIKDANGMTVSSGGPYNNLSAAGTTNQTPVSVTLSAQTCHTFTIYDSYGDGMMLDMVKDHLL